MVQTKKKKMKILGFMLNIKQNVSQENEILVFFFHALRTSLKQQNVTFYIKIPTKVPIGKITPLKAFTFFKNILLQHKKNSTHTKKMSTYTRNSTASFCYLSRNLIHHL